MNTGNTADMRMNTTSVSVLLIITNKNGIKCEICMENLAKNICFISGTCMYEYMFYASDCLFL